MVQVIRNIIDRRELPIDGADLIASLTEADGNYIAQEGLYWDFKREWPFSYSDEYFGGIARLICAFANTYGGLVIFGVHDQTRTGGHNKVMPNLDRLQQALASLLSAVPEMSCSVRRQHS